MPDEPNVDQQWDNFINEAFPNIREMMAEPGDPTGRPLGKNEKVTDADVQSFVNQRMGRVGLRPLREGQQTRGPGERFEPGSGRVAPPPGGTETDDGSIEPPTDEAPLAPPISETVPDQEDIGEDGDTDQGTPDSGLEGEPTTEPFIGEQELTPPTEEPPPGPPPTTVSVNGQDIPIDRILAYENFYERLQNDSGLRDHISSYMNQQFDQQQQQQTPPPAPEPPPNFWENLDLSDPNTATLAMLFNQQQQQINNLTQAQTVSLQDQLNRQRTEQQAVVNRAVDHFKTQYSLSDDEINHVRKAAAELNVFPALFQAARDPFTGEQKPYDTTNALLQSMQIAANNMPWFVERERGKWLQQRREQAKRKQKLAGVSGGSGSVPRTRQAPRNKAERDNAMLDEVRSYWNGGQASSE